MEKRVSREEIVKMHMVQQLERKKALFVNLQLQDNKSVREIVEGSGGIITEEDSRRYMSRRNISCGNSTLPEQLFLSNYFRGENAYYPDGKSLIYRKPAECTDKNSHSEWMGFTSNFDEALFYACCTCDENTGKYRPLEKKDFQAPECIGKADRRYGVIYMADCMDKRFWMGNGKEPEYNVMMPAGTWPCIKGGRQYVYAMRLHEEDDLTGDERFDRLVFEHTEELCRDIFRLMDGGNFL